VPDEDGQMTLMTQLLDLAGACTYYNFLSHRIKDDADTFVLSWAYWSFKDYNDITTANHGQQALYQVCSVNVLSGYIWTLYRKAN
jgi:hypothetical protein